MAPIRDAKKLVEVYDKSVRYIPGIGEKLANLFLRIEVENIFDLLHFYPRKWLDLRFVTDIKKAKIGDLAIIEGKAENISMFVTKKRGMRVIEANIVSNTGSIKGLWFNQIYMYQSLMKITGAIFVGKVEYNRTFGKYIASPKIYYQNEIIPIYPLTAGLSQYRVKNAVKTSIQAVGQIKDFFSTKELKKINLMNLDTSLKQIHFPTDFKILNEAKKRLAFNEMFFIHFNLLKQKQNQPIARSIAFNPDFEMIKKICEKLPFKLTTSQKKEIYIISQKLNSKIPMQRLLQGDVGSGKTIVAALSSLQIVKTGYQVFYMAPTEILARQHYSTFLKIFHNKFKVALVVSSQKDDWRNSDFVIGTQALIQKNISYEKVGLVIIDEQHRFGINQRNVLIKEHNGITPHYLSMSATPIPRSLAQIIYGQLELGRLCEMPKGRKPVKTKCFEDTQRNKVYTFIDERISLKEQVFIVCPRIEPKDDIGEESATGQEFLELDKKSVIDEFEKLQKSIFSHRRIAMLHGKMKPKEKEKILTDFREKKFDILVTTAVIEVGIDIPNASTILIESSERFGLAQLHQFRGRVGRAEQQAYCFLHISGIQNSRLKIMEKENDGFKLAEFDLQNRGPGDFIGSRQSGLPDFKMAEYSNLDMLEDAKNEAEKYFKTKKTISPYLEYAASRFIRLRKV